MSKRVIIGIAFDRCHFIRDMLTGRMLCSRGHTMPGGKFCSKCGGVLSPVFDREPTPQMIKMAEAAGVGVCELMADFPYGCARATVTPSFHPMLITTMDDGDDQTGNLAFGYLVTDSLTRDQLIDLMDSVAAEAAKYDLEDPVSLIIGYEYA